MLQKRRSSQQALGIVTIDGREIPYENVVNPRRKRVAITINDDLSVEIRSQKHLREDAAIALIRSAENWIADALRRKEIDLQKRPQRRYADGETISYLGRTLTVRQLKGETAVSARIWKDQLQIRLPPHTVPVEADETIRGLVMDAYREAVRPVAEDMAACAAAVIGVDRPRIRFGYQKRRFGSCTPKNGIIINLRIVQAPPEYLRYVITHETCHLIEKNHQKRFWELVGTVMPGYAQLHADLQKNGMQYYF
ncbi:MULTISPECIES: M48 family metallopeptidase [Methanocalculus]|uniref:M48 family metallopeptidase n=1 Tax=Methanocalculus TaxID=71151 RepID=UPI00209F5A62|nr:MULTISPECIES: SprT family zinc-dependent metalloprotease [unclassified Methanocalculus]MCP1662189.1 putative metal-dependent hydrolase [Methanocalculus sp. AMF5]